MRRSHRAVVAVVSIASVALPTACSHVSRQAPRSSNPSARSLRTTTLGAGRAASRVVFWTGCKDVVALSDEQLDEWHRRGAGGFVCVIQHLADLGGDQSFTADANSALGGPQYSLQKRLRDSKIVDRARARGIKLWLGFYLSNSVNPQTPLEEWFDDTAWSTHLIPRIADIAGAARALGFAGLAFDEEMYDGGSWDWGYDGNTHSESEVRTAVRKRGEQMMKAIVGAFPGVDLLDYGTYFPDGWNALVQEQINHESRPYAKSVQTDLWNGLTNVRGYSQIRFLDATFYKTAHLQGSTWDSAMTYNDNRLMAFFSRNLKNWAYASSRVQVSPFAWIDGDVQNEGSFTAPRPPAYVADQLAAFRKWGMGGVFTVYAYDGIEGTFDYGPYVPALQAAAQPGVVDTRPPTLTISTTKVAGTSTIVSGTATDDMVIRSVLCRAGANTKAASMTWSVTGGNWRTGYRWHTDWTAAVPAGSAQPIACTAFDAANNTVTLKLSAPAHRS